MDYPALMRVVDRIADLRHQRQPLAGVEFARFGILQQRLAADEFHGEVRL
jgi:hypothetical protein